MTSGPGRPTVRRGREEVSAVVAGGNPRDAPPGVDGGAGGDIFENEFSGMIKDERRAKLVWDYSLDAVRDFL